MKTENLPLYIGITDFENASQVREMLALRPFDHHRSLMVGVMMSYKTLHGIPTSKRWENIWPKPDKIRDIFIDDPAAFNTLHWADYDGLTGISDLATIIEHGGPNMRALQLDMVWPDPSLCWLVADEYHLPIVLQVGSVALDQIDNKPFRLINRLVEYEGSVSYVLLDKSMGRGQGMDAQVLWPFVEAIAHELPEIRIAVAGGLGPKSLDLVQPLMNKFPDLSIDAQGQLRPSGNATDPIDWSMAGDYLRQAFRRFL